MALYEVRLCFSGYDCKEVEGENEEEAIEKARERYDEVGFENPSDLLPWREADEVELIE